MITPCINICVIDPQSELCEGCGRNLDEISNWSRMSPEERRAVMDGLRKRLESLATTDA
ncbi:DUF1289 domain-containing protein [Kaistia granuli]|uniref:DUF1289 domain-containing protein n=1 Tax=Kaistia granuli TaxID=363259 RepID=UPI00036F81FB|nr:DUF1289 domain-containing protein [Kaistia granuli]